MEAKISLAFNLPHNIKAYSQVDTEGNYYIYVNETLCYAARERALTHEIGHIVDGDLYSPNPLVEIEGKQNAT